MAFAAANRDNQMSDMNITPLVDVMLVLLIIVMVTAPALSYPIQVDLPQPSLKPPDIQKDPPEPIRIRIEASGTVMWNNSPTPMSTLQSQFDVEGERTFEEQPTIEVDTDKDAEYETLAKVLARAKNAGLTKISFVQPDAE